MLLERKSSHWLTRLFVRLFAAGCLGSGFYIFVDNMARLALGSGALSDVFFALLLLVSGVLLLRLRSRGIWIFCVALLYACGQALFEDGLDFRLLFVRCLISLLLLSLLASSYFSLRRGEGRRAYPSVRLVVVAFYIFLTGFVFAACYEGIFCRYDG